MSAILSIFAVLLLGVIILRNPFQGVIIFVVALPFQNALPLLSGSLTLQVLIGLLIFTSFLLNTAVSRAPIRISARSLAAIGLLLWITFSNPQAALILGDRNWSFTYLQLVILFLIVENLVDTNERLQTVLYAFAVASVLAGCGEIIQWANRGFPELFTFRESILETVNEAARYYVLSSTITLAWLLQQTSISKQVVGGLGVAIQFLAILITGSKTALILILLSCLFIVFFILVTNRRHKLGAAVLFCCFVIAYLSVFDVFSLFTDTLIPTIELQTGTYGLRLILVNAGIEMFKDNPIWGVGIGQFPTALGTYGSGVGYYRANLLTAHNTYVQLIAETGIVGLTIFLGIVFGSIKQLVNVVLGKFPEPKVKRLAFLLLVLIITTLVGAWSKTEETSKLLWIFLAISSCSHRIYKISAQSTKMEMSGQKHESRFLVKESV
jgi:O-antigen ligase